MKIKHLPYKPHLANYDDLSRGDVATIERETRKGLGVYNKQCGTALYMGLYQLDDDGHFDYDRYDNIKPNGG